MAAGLKPWVLDRLIDLLICILQLLINCSSWIRRAVVQGHARQQRPVPTRGKRPSPPTTIGLVFAEPTPQEVSVQRAANLAVWCVVPVRGFDSAAVLRLARWTGACNPSSMNDQTP